MAQSEQVREYIEKVCDQVKSQKAHELISNELIEHIGEQTLKYRKDDMPEYIAEDQAMEKMGDPVSVGKLLNQIHRPIYNRIGVFANIAMWVIAGSMVLFAAIFGIGVAYTMISYHPGDYIAAMLVCILLISGGLLFAFALVSICKFIFHMLFNFDLIRDYKCWKKKGELHEFYKKP